jgi:hypothetical protein
MSTTQAPRASNGSLGYDVFVNGPPPQEGVLPNGESKRFSPMASTLIYGREDAVLTDPGMTADQARALGDWIAANGPSPRRASTSTTPRSSCGLSPARWTSSTPRTSDTPTTSGRTVMWAGVSTLYGAREHPDRDIRQIIVASWL